MSGESKEKLSKKQLESLKTEVEKDSWFALKQFFSGKKNLSEAKIAVNVLGTLAKEQQTKNVARQLDLIEKRIDTNIKQLNA